jgi:effector-binding domain-containing protein/ribosome-associated toxin RatA of RatAB toxin-antitoxin module
MRFLKRLLFFIIALVVLLFIVSFFLPSKMHVERSIKVNTKADAVYAQVNDIKTYNNWMPWNRKDSAMKQTYGPTTAGTGAYYSWESKHREVGNGKLTITESVPNKKVITQLDFMENGTAIGGWEMNESNGATDVKWFMDSEASGGFLWKAMGKYMFLFMQGAVEKDFDKGLADLKKVAETTPPPAPVKEPTITLEEKDMPAATALVIPNMTANSADEVGKKLGDAYAKIGEAAAKAGLKITGMPYAVYQGQNAPFVFDAGMPIDKKPAAVPEGMQIAEMPARKAAVAHYFGPYELMGKGYDSLKAWLLKSNKMNKNTLPYEIYVGDPMKEKDPYKVQTDIVWPY